jgi:hypothetical protein
MQDEFKVIEALANLVECPGISDEEKVKVMVETLQRYGLFEIGFSGDRNSYLRKARNQTLPEDPPKKVEDDIEWHPNGVEVPMELYNIRLMNAVVQFDNIMN